MNDCDSLLFNIIEGKKPLKYIGTDVRIILKRIQKKMGGRIQIGLSCLRMWTRDGL